MVTATTTQMSEEAEEVTEEALTAAEATAVAEITDITLHSPNHCLKGN